MVNAGTREVGGVVLEWILASVCDSLSGVLSWERRKEGMLWPLFDSK
jgi:hypothetical protein